jgi:hypothetical protein
LLEGLDLPSQLSALTIFFDIVTPSFRSVTI